MIVLFSIFKAYLKVDQVPDRLSSRLVFGVTNKILQESTSTLFLFKYGRDSYVTSPQQYALNGANPPRSCPG